MVINFHSKIGLPLVIRKIFRIDVIAKMITIGFKLFKIILKGIFERIIDIKQNTAPSSRQTGLLPIKSIAIYTMAIIILNLGSIL
jgi:hypothetical protein